MYHFLASELNLSLNNLLFKVDNNDYKGRKCLKSHLSIMRKPIIVSKGRIFMRSVRLRNAMCLVIDVRGKHSIIFPAASNVTPF